MFVFQHIFTRTSNQPNPAMTDPSVTFPATHREPLPLLYSGKRWNMPSQRSGRTSMRVFVSCAIALLFVSSAFAQKMQVKIIDHRESETGYSYQIPGQAVSNSNGKCSGTATGNGDNSADIDLNCSGTKTTTYTASRVISYSVTGATLSLLLPDGRLTVVNCVGKLTFGIPVTVAHHRSCRIPIVPEIEATFSGKSAKLRWPVSVDGKKFDSETYQVLGILPAR